MSYDYIAITRGSTILVQYATSGGNPDILINEIILSLKKGETKATREKGQQRFFILHDEVGLNFILIGQLNSKFDDSFRILTEIQRKFLLQFSRNWINCPPFGYQQEFSHQLKSFIENSSNSKILEIKNNLQEIQNSMTDSLEKTLLRGENINKLEDSTLKLSDNSNEYLRTSENLRRKLFFEKYKFLIIILLIILIIYFLLVIFCGSFTLSNC